MESKESWFFLAINIIFPIFLIFAEIVVRAISQVKDLEFWVAGLASSALGLLIGNLKPKPVKNDKLEAALKALEQEGELEGEHIILEGRDQWIIRLSLTLLVVELFLWAWICAINNHVAMDTMYIPNQDRWVAGVCYLLATILAHQKEKKPKKKTSQTQPGQTQR